MPKSHYFCLLNKDTLPSSSIAPRILGWIELVKKDIERILITGGAGFIGSHTVDLLVDSNFDVIILDNLDEQVHGKKGNRPNYLNSNTKFVKGDIRDRKLMTDLIMDVDAVFHLAAAVGIGQSMYQISRYIDANTNGTALLLDILANEEHNIKKLIVASSMSIYGEGEYKCSECGIVYPILRSQYQLKRNEWECKCPNCGVLVHPIPTKETKPLHPTSIYAQTKRHQEELCLLIGKTYGIPTIALRYFNVYGPRQSLSNPYTGVLAIFTTRVKNGKPPIVFEDGFQRRDFVFVEDIARANLLALNRSDADYTSVNIGSGTFLTIGELSNTICALYGTDLSPINENRFRIGDIRHCYADISKAKKLLGFEPKTDIKEGLSKLREWVATQKELQIEDKFDSATEELEQRGLLI